MYKLVALAAALTHARKHRIASVINGYVVYHFHYKHGLAYARTAEKTDLAALGIRHQQIYYLNARFKQLGSRLLL